MLDQGRRDLQTWELPAPAVLALQESILGLVMGSQGRWRALDEKGGLVPRSRVLDLYSREAEGFTLQITGSSDVKSELLPTAHEHGQSELCIAHYGAEEAFIQG